MPTRRQILAGIAAVPATASMATRAIAQTPKVFADKGAAIRGYDPVTYFTQGQPVAGNRDQSLIWNGAEWRFSTQATRAAFEADPTAYTPQYGGYCAYAVSRGYTASTDPQAWRIVDGRLYLNYSLRVRRLWEKDIPGNIASGDENWPGVLNA